MNGYEIVENYFKEWIETQTFIGRFYVAIFLTKNSQISFEQYECLCELFEYDIDEKSIIWQFDWWEGEDDIINLRFYSIPDIKNIIIDAENHELNNTCRKWFNVWR